MLHSIRGRCNHRTGGPEMKSLLVVAFVLFFVCSAQADCTIDHAQGDRNSPFAVGIGQSWIASCSGPLDAVTVKVPPLAPPLVRIDVAAVSAFTMSIFRGQSTDPGNLLGQSRISTWTEGENRVVVPGVTVKSGQTYTWYVEMAIDGGLASLKTNRDRFLGFQLVYSGNTYPDGKLYLNDRVLDASVVVKQQKSSRNGLPVNGWNDDYDAWFRVEIGNMGVPTLSQWGMIVFAIFLGILAIRHIRRQSNAPA